MKYISTRGQSKPLSFSEILLGGLAPDGGLYLPETYPKFTDQDLNAMRSMTYAELAFHIISKFIDDIPKDDLKSIIHKHTQRKCMPFRDPNKKLKTLHQY